ncbi:hypothetical protein Val02_92500 [Virgisporangium aliadipatigenens]|uniref:Uncharacterized protein n=1 Tax=Virgisporangium aliadipatigenens TaxID=741659 RepID=A0A8J3YVC9_9ACTN|nr:hypothetical protein [Virgisporangium aliadipatigenens]GIJ52364.1 hypothetical protein Val02_92500 [Virgisporangium aliadipatigenens]
MAEPVAEGLNALRVDLEGVRAFAQSLRGDLDGSMRPTGFDIAHQHSGTVPFGWFAASGGIADAHREYAFCLAGSREAMGSFLDAIDTMIAGVTAVIETYGTADALASADLDSVKELYGNAARPTAPPPTSGGKAVAS